MKAALAAWVLMAAAQLVSASSCDVSCSSFKSDTACQDGARTTCALCDWNTTTSTCDEEPNMCEEQCNNCRAFGPLICPAVNASADACQKLNTDDCVVCAWSGGACEKASCSASCPHFKTEAACMEATSGPCPFTCSWDVSKG